MAFVLSNAIHLKNPVHISKVHKCQNIASVETQLLSWKYTHTYAVMGICINIRRVGTLSTLLVLFLFAPMLKLEMFIQATSYWE